MTAIKMSNSAYEEFTALLKENKIDETTLRIVSSGGGCGGPGFGIVLDEQKDNDLVEQIQDLTFLVEEDLFTEFGCLTIKSGEENGYGGISVESEISSGGCGGCSGCGH